MSVAALREELQRELTVRALGELRPVKTWELWAVTEPLVREHVPSGTRVRLPLRLMPDWYQQLWWDRTQIDGRVEVVITTSAVVRVNGVSPDRAGLDTTYSISTEDFLGAVLDGSVGDAS